MTVQVRSEIAVSHAHGLSVSLSPLLSPSLSFPFRFTSLSSLLPLYFLFSLSSLVAGLEFEGISISLNDKSSNSKDFRFGVIYFWSCFLISFNIFFLKELVKVHRNLMQEIHDSIVNKNDQNLYQVFINYKER